MRTMDDTELALLYTGYGYQVRFVEYKAQGETHMGGGASGLLDATNFAVGPAEFICVVS
jgi:hypothetical protein